MTEDDRKTWYRRICTLVGFAILSCGFMEQSDKGKLTADMFLTYPLGSTMFYWPRMFEKLLKIWKGNAPNTDV